MNQNRDFYKNIFAFIIGAIFLNSDLFSSPFQFSEIKTSLFMGYITLSIYHGFKFASRKFSDFDMFSFMLIWFIPLIFVFILIFSFIYGLIVSIPKTIVSGYRWNEARKYKKMQQQPYYQQPYSQTQYSTHNSGMPKQRNREKEFLRGNKVKKSRQKNYKSNIIQFPTK